MKYSLRLAKEADIDHLLAIENACFNSDKINRRQMRYLLCKAKAVILVATDNSDKAVGYAIVFTPQTLGTSRLYSLAVLSEYRGHGLGKALINALIKYAQRMGYKAMNLEVRKSHLKTQFFYNHFGFKPIKLLPFYYTDNEDGLRMRLAFNEPSNTIKMPGVLPCPLM